MQFTIILTSVWAACTVASCVNQKQSVEWRLLSSSQKDAYLNALKCVRSTPSKLLSINPKLKTAWEDLSWVHYSMAVKDNSIHNTAQFLPWHRLFLALHDKLMQNCGYNGPFPYWDWTIDAQAPEKAPVWKDFGTSPTGQVKMRIVGALNSFFPGNGGKSSPVTRNWAKPQNGKAGLMGAFYSSTVLGHTLDLKNYDAFRRDIEGTPHNQVHNGVGGDMSSLISANDPIFYLHHRNIDRYWAVWQARSSSRLVEYSGNTNPGSSVKDAKKSDVLNFLGLADAILGKGIKTTVNDTLNIKGCGKNGLLCYNYQNSATPTLSLTNVKRHGRQSTTPDAFDRSDRTSLRIPPPIPESYLRMMNYDDASIARVRKQEAKKAKLIKFCNKLGIPFHSALKNHELGERYGWRQRSDSEKAARSAQRSKIIAEFNNQNQIK